MKSGSLIALCLASALIGAAAMVGAPGQSASTAPVVTTDTGKLAGVTTGGVSAFLGVPYAGSPAGANRWKAPQPVAAWNGVRQATAFGPSCPQNIMPNGLGPWTPEYMPSGATSEDCLSLNVWTANTAAKKKMPVLVWIHGGGFISGSTSVQIYDGAAMARAGIVVVSLNYRVGVLGFLGSREFRRTGGGNFGLQDQLAALHWVQRNIARFGGDPQQVTIAGQSAGAASVHAHILSPLSRGLFQRAIPQSGVGLGLDPTLNLASRDSTEAAVDSLFNAAGISSVEEARHLSPEQLTAAFLKAGGRPGGTQAVRTAPYADGVVLPLDPVAAFAAGKYNDTPVLIGLTADEGSGLNANYRVSDPAKYRELLRSRFGSLAPQFEALYPAATASRSFPAIIRDGGTVSVINWNQQRAKTSRQPLYAYMWTHTEPGPLSALYGAFHTSEVPYIFKTLDKAPARGFTSDDQRISSVVSNYWVNFVKTGDPNGRNLPRWPQYGAMGQFLNLDGSFSIYSLPNVQKIEMFQKHLASKGSLFVF